MSKCENNWQYTEQYPLEQAIVSSARRMSLECGIEPVGRATAAFLASFALTSRSETILEIGTGVGVSGLSLMQHLPKAELTTIDIEAEFHKHAKKFFVDAGIIGSRLRLVSGEAERILPRLNDSFYDLILIDADPDSTVDYVEKALTIVKPGGTIIIPRALRSGKVSNPATRDHATVAMRDLLATVSDSKAIVASLTPTGDGILTLTRSR